MTDDTTNSISVFYDGQDIQYKLVSISSPEGVKEGLFLTYRGPINRHICREKTYISDISQTTGKYLRLRTRYLGFRL